MMDASFGLSFFLYGQRRSWISHSSMASITFIHANLVQWRHLVTFIEGLFVYACGKSPLKIELQTLHLAWSVE